MAIRHLKKASTATLIRQLLKTARDVPDRDTDEYWLRVRILWRRRPGLPTFHAAVVLCEGSDVTGKCVGADILRGLNGDWVRYHFPFSERSAPVIDNLLDEQDVEVLVAALHALQLLRCVPTARLVPLAAHVSASVRFHVIDALTIEDDDLALRTVIALSQDEEGFVRDWATFRLGTSEIDSPTIREALFERTTDSDDDARGEAIVGLARRKDARVVGVIAAELDHQTASSGPYHFAAEAAEEMPSRAYVPALGLLLAKYPDGHSISDALAKCLAVADEPTT